MRTGNGRFPWPECSIHNYSHLFLAVVACNEKYRTYNSKKREVSYKNMKSQSAYIRVHWTNYLVTPTQSVFYYDTNSLLFLMQPAQVKLLQHLQATLVFADHVVYTDLA
jgi:hypothetical protein